MVKSVKNHSKNPLEKDDQITEIKGKKITGGLKSGR